MLTDAFFHTWRMSQRWVKACRYLDSGTMIFFFLLFVGFELYINNENDADPNGSTL